MPQLPAWISYLNALAVPAIAAVGALIAIQQMWIARDRLEHDVFYRDYDSRRKVFEATREFLARGFGGSISEDDIRAYRLHTLDARFLFDDDMAKYLSLVCYHVTAWKEAVSHLEKLPSGDQRDAYEAIRVENLAWIREQGDDGAGFEAKFAPFLKRRTAKRSRLRFLHKG
jgi:hypothetical protein